VSRTEWVAKLTVPVTDDRDHIQGPADAPVTLVEYGDYECPYCGAAYPIVKQVQARMGDRVRFVFRNFPITTSHPHAEQAAEAAEAAAAQGRFWEMHDVLYENQRRLGDQDLRGYAEQVGLNVDSFDRDLAEHVHAARVREDFMSGARSGVNGTPTFYINGVRHDDSYDVDTLLAALNRAAG
jgi:protein-disulfide isomerase